MCGIYASINTDAQDCLIGLDTFKHRGPDSSGVFQEDNLWLGHVRLAIQDLSENGHQPMISACERYVMVFNGEIYNHWELRKRMPKVQFKSSSDTETVLELFALENVACFELLNGIFALTIYDRVAKKVIIARDHYGVKPLYYYRDKDKFTCASEIKAILSTLQSKSLDQEAIKNYLTFMWSPGEKTPFKEVKKLLPGNYVEMNLNDVNDFKVKEFYKVSFKSNSSNLSEKEWIEKTDTLLFNAMENQLLSDAPVGFFLSGGLDSSLLVAMAKKKYPDKRLVCYTIDSGPSLDGFARDLDYAEIVAKHLDVELRVIPVDPNISSGFDHMVWHLDEPQADPAPLNVSYIAQQARKDGIKVLISGTGGDDVFSGYRRHQSIYLDKYVNLIPQFIRVLIAKLVKGIVSKKPIIRRLKKLTGNWGENAANRSIGFFEWNSEKKIDRLFLQKEEVSNYHPLAYLKSLWDGLPKNEHHLNKALFLEIYTFLVDHNLNYTDKMGMAHGVEIRVPFMDLNLVEFSTQIPTDLKMKGTTTKYILRKVAENYLPMDVIYRPKSGFGAPVESWIRGDLKQFVEQRLSKNNIEKFGVFDYNEIRLMIDNNLKGIENDSYTIWSLMAIQSWLEQFYESK